MDGAAISFVLFEFGVAKRVVQMIAERGPHDLVAVEFGKRLTQRFRQRPDPALAAIAIAQFVRASGFGISG